MQYFFYQNDKPILLFFILAIIISGPMLLPGYILTLDMFFTPTLRIDFYDGFYTTAPLVYTLKAFNLFLPGWIIQKMVIVSIFFLPGFFAYRYLAVSNKVCVRYWVGFFYVVNPFVYERFLAGHWRHLLAYSVLPIVWDGFFQLLKAPRFKTSLRLFLAILLVGFFSLHMMVICCVLFGVTAAAYLVWLWLTQQKQQARRLLHAAGSGAAVFVGLNLYWLVPYILKRKDSLIQKFSVEHWQAFQTVANEHIGPLWNVLSLYGFWLEKTPWIEQFISPRTHLVVWSGLAIMLCSIVFYGVVQSFGKDRVAYPINVLVLCLGILAWVCAVGVAETSIKPINTWLFTHIPFWSGFRDSQKFSAILVGAVAYFGGVGINSVHDRLVAYGRSVSVAWLYGVFLITSMYTFPMVVGFSGQLQPVWYPPSWGEINTLLMAADQPCRAIFLPWHQYYTPTFNHLRLVTSPAKHFFDCDMIYAENIEFASLKSPNATDVYRQVDALVTQGGHSAGGMLQSIGVDFIIFDHSLGENDPFLYSFLHQDDVELVYTTSTVSLYRVL